uniref:Chemosensory protein 1 n=1 Tax=Sogatella furcifera TaxID=113103 RepID=A0A096W1H9_SOGFU|nr:chemosensory protein 1 [Sogatella furcifera]
MFNLLTLVVCLSTIAVQIQAAPEEAQYTTKYDKINLDEILNNDRLFKSYFGCLMGGKCTPDGQTLRDILPDALETACSKCSDTQKAGTEKVFKFMIEKKPSEFADLEKKYDPNGKYRARYEADAEKFGIKV